MNSTKPRGTSRIADRRRGNYSKVEASPGTRGLNGSRKISCYSLTQHAQQVVEFILDLPGIIDGMGDFLASQSLAAFASFGDYAFSQCTGLTSVLPGAGGAERGTSDGCLRSGSVAG